MTILADTEHLAPVIELHPPEPRHLAYRIHHTEPPHSLAIDHLGWAIEQQLTALADADVAPAVLLATFGHDTAAARDALDALFDAAQDVADRVNGQGDGPVYLYEDAYSDALYDLAQIVRGAA